MRIFVLNPFLLAVIAVWVSAASATRAEQPTLLVDPLRAELNDRLARVQLLIRNRTSQNQLEDVTRSARYENETPAIVTVDSDGYVTPRADGSGRIRIRYGELEQVVRFEVRLPQKPSVSFTRDVIPAITKAGCNQAACHASQYGKGGFKLSLFGSAPSNDYVAIVRDWNQRRVSPVEPENSLILKKATLSIPHGGGRVVMRNSYEHEILRSWIASGAPGPQSIATAATDLVVTPDQGTFRVGQSQQLRVVASFDDGTSRDVTHIARYDSFSDGVVSVGKRGVMKVVGRGQGVVMVRFGEQARVARVLSPFRDRVDLSEFVTNNFIDQHAREHWERLGLQPSEICTDAEFIRRAFLDSIGTLPSPKRVKTVLASKDENKRSALIDQLLGLTGDPARDVYSKEWSAYWTMKWGDLLKNNRKKAGDSGMWAMHNWILRSVRENKPVDQFVRELITAEGSVFENGPVNFIAYGPRPTDLPVVAPATDLAETTAQVFLGVRLQCARCHQHPFEVYSQDDYYGFAAFFTQLESKPTTTFGELGFDATVSVRGSGSIKHPRRGTIVAPKLLQAETIDTAAHHDLRMPLAQWLTAPDNKLFARNIVNRVWGQFMGVGLIEPVDDVRATNPPSNPGLLDALAADFVLHKFDLKHLMRRIMNSRVYQLSSLPRSENATQTRYYTHYNVKRLPAEVLLDALDFACGTQEKFPRVPLGTRAIELPDPNFESYFLDTLGRPQRVVACECERTAEPNLAQVLQIANGEVLQRKLTDENGRIAAILKRKVNDTAAIRELYLATFSRQPRGDEVQSCLDIIRRSADRKQGLENVLWALCNSREFLFNH